MLVVYRMNQVDGKWLQNLQTNIEAFILCYQMKRWVCLLCCFSRKADSLWINLLVMVHRDFILRREKS